MKIFLMILVAFLLLDAALLGNLGSLLASFVATDQMQEN